MTVIFVCLWIIDIAPVSHEVFAYKKIHPYPCVYVYKCMYVYIYVCMCGAFNKFPDFFCTGI